MLRKNAFLGTVSGAVLILYAGGAFAQNWSPTATNTGSVIVGGTIVDNQGNTINALGDLIGDGSSASISGVGASSSVSTTTITPVNPVGTVLGFNGGDFPAITNSATNNTGGSVSNTNNTIAFDGGSQLSGSAAGASISSTGASSSTSWTGIGTTGLAVGNVASVTQSSTNASGTTGDATRVTVGDATISGAPDLTGNATSLSVSATGATTSVGARAIESDNFGMAAGASVGPITQTATQNRDGSAGMVVTSGTNLTSGAVEGVASSASVSATGAANGVSTTIVDSDGFAGLAIGTVDQTARNIGGITTSLNTVQSGAVSGDVAGVSLSVTGATAGVSESLIGATSLVGSVFGTVSQDVRSLDGSGSITAGAVGERVGSVVTGVISGDAASARISASSATASVSTLAADSTIGGATQFGNIDQTVQSSKGTFMRGGFAGENLSTGELSGAAASASYSATGAAGSVGATMVGSSGVGSTFGTIDQDIQSNTNRINIQSGNVAVGGDLSGSAASVSVSATGASGSVAATSVNSTRSAGAEFGAIDSNVTRNPSGASSNDVSLESRQQINVTGALSGNATSASMSANGAIASVSDTIINGAAETNTAANTKVASIDLTASVDGTVLAGQTTGTSPRLSIDTGALSGAGASARIGSLGASAGVSSVAIDGSGRSLRVSGDTNLSATSTANVSTNQADVTTGVVSGNGASASISATGAATSVSATKVDVSTSGARALFGDITQAGGNSGSVAVTESNVTTSGLTGASAGASVSAVGYSASVSVLNLGSGDTARQYGLNSSSITQGTTAAPITNSGAVSVSDTTVTSGAISGPAASASIGARGVAGSISLASIATTGAGVNGGGGASSNFGSISQVISNDAAGTVSITGGTINASGISGAGAAASISAVGASGSVGVNTIVADSLVQAVFNGPITQTVANAAPVSVQASTIAAGGAITGNGASAGISVIGSSASVSFTTVNAGAIR